MFCGPIGLDRALFKVLQNMDSLDQSGRVKGTVLSYNPWRRLVFKKEHEDGRASVVRVWAEPPATVAFLPALEELGAPVLPVLGMTQHSVEQPWISGGDFTARLVAASELSGRESEELLRSVAQTLARLHGIDPTELLALTNRRMDSSVPGAFGRALRLPGINPVASLNGASNGVAYLNPGLLSEFETVADRVIREIAENPGQAVVSHGDLSADQVVVGEDGSPRLIDLDRLKAAPAGYDLGDFAAVEILEGRSSSSAVALADAYREFVSGRPVSNRAVRAWTAFHILLRVTDAFRNLEPDCVTQARHRIDLARAVLQGEMR